jgi:hypothetical protein
MSKSQYHYLFNKIDILEEQVSRLQNKEKEHLTRIKDLESLNFISILDPDFAFTWRCNLNTDFILKSISIKAVIEKILDHLNLSLEYTPSTKESVILKKGVKPNVK